MSPEAVDWTSKVLEGRYRVLRALGAGGMGTIYLAEDVRVGRRVVVKVPHESLLEEPGFRSRFENEVRSLTRLAHPHVVKALDAGRHEDVPFAIIEHLPGGSLKDRLARLGGRQALDEVAGWLPPVADALDYIHRQGVVHRDVKPANILFDARGAVYLADFGIAKALGATHTGLTQTGATPGSPDYMAPEAVVGSTLSPAYDQYALAVVVFKALSGQLPHDGGSGGGVAVLARRAYEPARRITDLAPGVPPAAADVLARALDRDPLKRYPTCTAFAEAFGKAAGLRTSAAEASADTGADGAGDEGGGAGGDVADDGAPRPRRALLVGVLLAIGVGVAGVLALGRSSPTPDSSRAVTSRPTDVQDAALATAREAASRGEWEAVRRALSTFPVGSEATADLRKGLAAYDAPPVLEVEAPPSGFVGTARLVEVRGRLSGQRPSDVVRVGGRAAPVIDGAFHAQVQLSSDGDATIEVEVRDGEKERARVVRRIRIDPPWRGRVERAGDLALAADWAGARAAIEEAYRLGAKPEDVPVGVRDALARQSSSPTLSLADPVEGAELAAGEILVRGRVVGAPPKSRVRVAGIEVDPVDGAFEARVTAAPGPLTLRVEVLLDGLPQGEPLVRSVTIARPPPPFTVEVPTWAKVSEAQVAEARALRIPVAFENGIGMRFVLVPHGTFTMGSPPSEADRDDDEERHEVTLTRAYYLGITEVTNAQMRRAVPTWTSKPRFKPEEDRYAGLAFDGDDQPVMSVSHDDATAFTGWLTRQDPSRRYRLPTESEWERAARAGTNRVFLWGDADDKSLGAKWANLRDASLFRALKKSGAPPELDDGYAATAPVGRFLANPYGLHDMAGNVAEWCYDWYWDYPAGASTDPTGHPRGSTRVTRGGAWDSTGARLADRFGEHPGTDRVDTGFRVAVDAPKSR